MIHTHYGSYCLAGNEHIGRRNGNADLRSLYGPRERYALPLRRIPVAGSYAPDDFVIFRSTERIDVAAQLAYHLFRSDGNGRVHEDPFGKIFFQEECIGSIFHFLAQADCHDDGYFCRFQIRADRFALNFKGVITLKRVSIFIVKELIEYADRMSQLYDSITYFRSQFRRSSISRTLFSQFEYLIGIDMFKHSLICRHVHLLFSGPV